MPRFVSIIAWILLVIGGLCILTFCSDRGGKSSVVTRRDLPRNTLVQASDIEQPTFVNRYVVAPAGVSKGAALRPEDVADQPVLPELAPAKLLLSLSVPRADVVKGINAGSKLKLCGKAPLAYGEVTVLAVRCGSNGTSATCSTLVELPTSAGADVATKGLKDQASTMEMHLAADCR
jgi:hypothetical protein